MLIHLGLKSAIFGRFFIFFCLFSLGKGSEIFLGAKKKRLENLTQSGFRSTYLNSLTHFGQLCTFVFKCSKSHFPLFSNINWDFPKYPLTKDVLLLGTSKTIKYMSTTKNHITFWNGGGAWEAYLAPRLFDLVTMESNT